VEEENTPKACAAIVDQWYFGFATSTYGWGKTILDTLDLIRQLLKDSR
jgi:hypothetical protein